ncbi:MAG: DUF4271 domain-containing protein [Prevotellaceae bacterium]|jgi:hypothetical protein|nr:DUF4271 domain-containing protein [Prevotellaceae bacterium]
MPTIVNDNIILQPDTLEFAAIARLRDSLHALQRADVVADSLAQVAKATSGFTGTPLHAPLGASPLIPVLLLLLFFLTGYIFTHWRKLLTETVKDFFYLKERSSIFIESTANMAQMSTSFVLLFVGSVSLFLYSLFFYARNTCELYYLGLFAIATLAFIGIKLLIFKVIGFIFFEQNLSRLFIKSYFSILFGLGLLLFPLTVGLIYMPPSLHQSFLILALFLCIVAFFLMIYKTLQIFLHKYSSFFYIMLYLCALEILPILIVLKVIA